MTADSLIWAAKRGDLDAIFSIFVGAAFIVVALSNRKLYWRRKGPELGPEIRPRWVGAILVGGIGILFLLVGLKYAFFGN
jgi:uncharacterized iron-regulated membrane protein